MASGRSASFIQMCFGLTNRAFGLNFEATVSGHDGLRLTPAHRAVGTEPEREPFTAFETRIQGCLYARS